jgi:hypothetical protein
MLLRPGGGQGPCWGGDAAPPRRSGRGAKNPGYSEGIFLRPFWAKSYRRQDCSARLGDHVELLNVLFSGVLGIFLVVFRFVSAYIVWHTVFLYISVYGIFRRCQLPGTLPPVTGAPGGSRHKGGRRDFSRFDPTLGEAAH